MVNFLAWLIHRQWHIPPICASFLHICLSFLVILRLIRSFQDCHPNSSNSYSLSPHLVSLTVERYWQNPGATWIGRWWTQSLQSLHTEPETMTVNKLGVSQSQKSIIVFFKFSTSMYLKSYSIHSYFISIRDNIIVSTHCLM